MLTLFAFVAYLFMWEPSPDSAVVYGVFVNDSLIAETADTFYMHVPSDTGCVEYAYGVRYEDGTLFAKSEPVPATVLDYTQGSEAYRFVDYNGEAIGNVAIRYPSGNWHTSYADGVFKAVYEYDYNKDGIVNLSDFGWFAESDFTFEELNWFIDMYGKQSIFVEVF